MSRYIRISISVQDRPTLQPLVLYAHATVEGVFINQCSVYGSGYVCPDDYIIRLNGKRPFADQRLADGDKLYIFRQQQQQPCNWAYAVLNGKILHIAEHETLSDFIARNTSSLSLPPSSVTLNSEYVSCLFEGDIPLIHGDVIELQ